tara:strand:- start:10995 stop:11519 length:525 start_codon:yes stop_codon:yes gene_type:complete
LDDSKAGTKLVTLGDMAKGRKKIPTKIKEMQGTLTPGRYLENEMEVTSLAEIPSAPAYLNELGKLEWNTVASELHAKGMLHFVDLALLSAYCNEMATYLEASEILNRDGKVERTYRDDGRVRSSKLKPENKIARDALISALKLATQFGFTPSARASIPQPKLPENSDDEFNFFN